MTPVEVSLCTNVIASYLPDARVLSTNSAVIGFPSSTSIKSALIPLIIVTSCHLRENAPHEKFAQRFKTVFLTAASQRPVAEQVQR